jgi:hypothetical protein
VAAPLQAHLSSGRTSARFVRLPNTVSLLPPMVCCYSPLAPLAGHVVFLAFCRIGFCQMCTRLLLNQPAIATCSRYDRTNQAFVYFYRCAV